MPDLLPAAALSFEQALSADRQSEIHGCPFYSPVPEIPLPHCPAGSIPAVMYSSLIPRLTFLFTYFLSEDTSFSVEASILTASSSDCPLFPMKPSIAS